MISQGPLTVDLKDIHAMNDAHSMDPSWFLSDYLAQASANLLRSKSPTFMHALMGADRSGRTAR